MVVEKGEERGKVRCMAVAGKGSEEGGGLAGFRGCCSGRAFAVLDIEAVEGGCEWTGGEGSIAAEGLGSEGGEEVGTEWRREAEKKREGG